MAARTFREKKSFLPLNFNVYFNLDNRGKARLAVRSLSTSMARALKSARGPRQNKTNMTSQFRVDKRKIVEVNGGWKLSKKKKRKKTKTKYSLTLKEAILLLLAFSSRSVERSESSSQVLNKH